MKEVPLTNSPLVALVDDEDYERLSKTKWHLAEHYGKKTYVRSTSNPYRGLHTEVMGKPPQGLEWDHHNCNPLDNQKGNLRLCNRSQNCANQTKRKRNTSGYKGVFVRGRKWRSGIRVNYRLLHLGTYDNPISAARAYDEAAKQYFGEYARTNF